jgi:hypothetical protein
MAEEPMISGDAASLGQLTVTNLLIDALVSHDPRLAAAIEQRLVAKLRELPGSGLEPAAPYLQMVLRALTQSARSLQRSDPTGRA